MGVGERDQNDVKVERANGECVPNVHNSNLGGLGAALAQPNGITIRIVHKGGSDI